MSSHAVNVVFEKVACEKYLVPGYLHCTKVKNRCFGRFQMVMFTIRGSTESRFYNDTVIAAMSSHHSGCLSRSAMR